MRGTALRARPAARPPALAPVPSRRLPPVLAARRRPRPAPAAAAAAAVAASPAPPPGSPSWWSLDEGGPPPPPLRPARQLAARLWRVMAPDPGLLAAASLFLAAAAAAELAVPHLTAAAVASAAAHGAGPELTRDAARLAGAALAFGVCAALRGFLFSLLNTRLLHHLRGQLFDALVSAPAGAHEAEPQPAAAAAAAAAAAECRNTADSDRRSTRIGPATRDAALRNLTANDES